MKCYVCGKEIDLAGSYLVDNRIDKPVCSKHCLNVSSDRLLNKCLNDPIYASLKDDPLQEALRYKEEKKKEKKEKQISEISDSELYERIKALRIEINRSQEILKQYMNKIDERIKVDSSKQYPKTTMWVISVKNKGKQLCVDENISRKIKQYFVDELGEQPENVSIYPVITDLKKIKL